MERKIALLLVLVTVVWMSGTACVTSNPKKTCVPVVKDASSYSFSKKNAEAAIRSILLESEQAWNEKNTEKYLSLFSADAEIMLGREQKMFVKEEYAKFFPGAFDRAGTVKYESLSVKVLDKETARAEGVGSISSEGGLKGAGGLIWLTKKIDLIKKDGKWLISKSTFSIYYKGDIDPRDTRRPNPGESL